MTQSNNKPSSLVRIADVMLIALGGALPILGAWQFKEKGKKNTKER